MTCSRVVDLTAGVVMVVTDLHGDLELYRRYRDRFLSLQAWGFAQTLIFCGDLIHREAPARRDGSLEIMLDLLALKERLGPHLIVLLGNHELPHIYGVTLTRGEIDCTTRFEQAMGAHRAAILALLRSLPFYVRTRAGVMLSHAGAPPTVRLPGDWERLRAFDHDGLLAQADARSDTADFAFLWEALFTRNELDVGEAQYAQVLEVFLRVASAGFTPQRILVAGHIPTRGRAIVARRHLRLNSGAYNGSTRDASYLLLDAARPVRDVYELLPRIYRING